MNLDHVKGLSIAGKNVVRLELNGKVVWKKSDLPIGYTELDYIECTGTQYIDSGFILNQDSRIVCEFMYKGGAGVYGARNTVSSNNFSMRVISGKWQMGYGDGVTSGTIPSDTTNWHVADHNKNRLFIDGELAAERTYEEFTPNKAAAIGAIRAGSVYYGDGRYRTCQMYDDGVLVRDFRPCISPDGEIGMYDVVNSTFHGNAGTGEFVAGEVMG